MVITHEQFVAATGREPQDDDLERANCPMWGHIAHSCCGWNEEKNLPQADVGPRYRPWAEVFAATGRGI